MLSLPQLSPSPLLFLFLWLIPETNLSNFGKNQVIDRGDVVDVVVVIVVVVVVVDPRNLPLKFG